MDLTNIDDEFKEDYVTIVESRKFNATYYFNKYNINKEIDPILHFLQIGVHKGFNPSPHFDTEFYLKNNKDVENNNMNPFIHYIKYGHVESRLPRFFSLEHINKLNIPTLEMAEEYLIILYSDQFDAPYYINENNLDKHTDPILHFLQIGVHEGLNPNPYFDINYYLEHNINAKNSNMNPFIYYLKYDNFNFADLKKYSIDDIFSLNLKRTLKGKDGFLFLINDGNNELRQHFDFKYQNQFKPKEFLDSYYFKKNLFEKNDIDYYFFNIPDKSVVCKKLLPFYDEKTTKIKRNVDTVNEIIDFERYLNHTCYYRLDSHINFKGGEILSYLSLNYMDNTFDIDNWNKMLNQGYIEEKYYRDNDLLFPRNWSYSYKERENILKQIQNHSETTIKPKNMIPLEIKEKFKFCKKRESFFFTNPNSFSDKTALIFRDSTFEFLMNYFSFYFRNMFIYWDHGTLNDSLINHINPDIIIEIRMERFIDDLITPKWVSAKKNIFQ